MVSRAAVLVPTPGVGLLTANVARVEAANAVIEFLRSPDNQIKGFQLGRMEFHVAKVRSGAKYWVVTAHDVRSAAMVCVHLTGGYSASTIVRACGSHDNAPSAYPSHLGATVADAR